MEVALEGSVADRSTQLNPSLVGPTYMLRPYSVIPQIEGDRRGLRGILTRRGLNPSQSSPNPLGLLQTELTLNVEPLEQFYVS